MKTCYQINLQQGLGGGEIYTRFFTRALLQLGWSVVLFVHREARHWDSLRQPGLNMVPVGAYADIPPHIPQYLSSGGALVITHSPALGEAGQALRARGGFLVSFAHMPLYGRDPQAYRDADLIFAVSQHVIDSLEASGIRHCYPAPLYGVADFERGPHTGQTAIARNSPYDWDRRKFRDRLLAALYPLYAACRPRAVFARRPGLTLGIVSRLTPIKQFPLMFKLLAPVLQRFPTVNIEIFGSGGYASVRDLRRSIAPIKRQVQFWGQQSDVRSIYQQIDYLLTGLPEKEALGLNVIEAQVCGTPVLAVDAPPFTETIAPGKSGLLFTDPREDQGRSFAELLARLVAGHGIDRTSMDTHHLERFTFDAFRARVAAALHYAESALGTRWPREVP